MPEVKNYNERYDKRVLSVRIEAITEIIETYGKDKIWEFINDVKSPESIAECLVTLYVDQDFITIYKLDLDEKLTSSFTRAYYNILAFKIGIDRFIELLEKVSKIDDKKLGIVASSIRYQKKIREFIATRNEYIVIDFWGNVNVLNNNYDDSADYQCQQLVKVNRIIEAIILASNPNIDNKQILDETKLSLVRSAIQHDPDIKYKCKYQLCELVLELGESKDPQILKELQLCEFVLFDLLQANVDINKLYIVKLITNEPIVMMQLIELLYSPYSDIDSNEIGNDSQNEYISNLLRIGYSIYLHLDMPLCVNVNGQVDTIKLRQYITELNEIAETKHYTKETNEVIGKMLANTPEDGNYPPTYLCDLLEYLNNEDINDAFCIQMMNRQGVTIRSVTAGGTIERERIKTIEKYKEKTRFRYRNITLIFDKLINEYKIKAAYEDINAKLTDYR